MKGRSALMSCAALTAAFSLASPARATEDVGSAEQVAEADAGGDIVVTAQRREQLLRDVPIAITAITGQGLESAGINSAQDLGLVTPGLNFAVQGAFAQPTIRGIGTSVTGPGADANVAIYVDGIYQPSQTANLFSFNNIERVEVLKGPQGTLFGRNATGGAIRIMTLDPDDEMRGRVGAGYGRFNEITANGFVNLPLGERVAANVAALFTRDSGYIDNIPTGNKIGRTRDLSVRGKLKVEAGDRLSFVLGGNFSDVRNNAPFAVRPIDNNNFLAAIVDFPDGYYETALSFDPVIRTKSEGVSLTARLETDAGTFTSISSYQNIRPDLVVDIDNSPVFNSHAVILTREKNATQELNFASDFDGPLNFVAGIYYYYDKTRSSLTLTSGSPPVVGAIIDTQVKTSAISGYAEATYEVSPGLELTGGVRYSSERKHALGGVPGVQIVDDATRWNSLTPRAVARYSIGPSSNVYASYSRGFKSGNYNVSSLSNVPVKPEIVDAFEIGLKTSGRGLSFNASAYYYDYKDIQVQIQTNAGGQLATLLQNAATAEIYGFDADLTLPVGDSFNVVAGMAYTHARYGDFEGAILTRPITDANGIPTGGNIQGPGSASGAHMIRTPDFTANLTGTYTTELAGGQFEFSATGSYSGGFYWDPGETLKQDSYFLLNGQISWTSPGDDYRLSLWGRNLTSQKYLFYVNNTATGNSGAPAKPWSIGGKIDFFF